jgi:hypothetical protein
LQLDAKNQYIRDNCDKPMIVLREQCRRWLEKWRADEMARITCNQTVSENVTREFAKTANKFIITLKSSTVIVLIALLSIVSLSCAIA